MSKGSGTGNREAVTATWRADGRVQEDFPLRLLARLNTTCGGQGTRWLVFPLREAKTPWSEGEAERRAQDSGLSSQLWFQAIL